MASRLRASRLLAAVLLANLITLSVCNGLRAPVSLVLAWPLVVAGCFLALRPGFIRRPQTRLPRLALLLAGACLLLLTIPRLPYLLEWIPGNAVLAQADDHGRLAELVSLTLSAHFPPVHPGNQDLLLSHYFAALLPMAWCKLALPLLTLKDCILIGNAFYHLLMLGTLLEFAAHTMPTPRRGLALVFFATFFSGFDWLVDAQLPFSHSEHWPRDVFGALREISGFYTAHYWVVHHMAALWALVLAFLFSTRARFASARRGRLLCGALILAAGVHSPFVMLGALACSLPTFWRVARRCWQDRTLAVLAFVAVPIFPFFLRRLDPQGVWWHPAPAAYLPAAILIDLAALPVLLAFRWRGLTRSERRAALGAAGFLVLTWPLESVGYNNFAMRGLLAPCLLMFWLCARHLTLRLPPAVLAVTLFFVSWGTLREAAWLTYQPLQYSIWYWQARGRPAPPATLVRPHYARLARDRSTRIYTPDQHDRLGLNKFNAEKLVTGLPPSAMDRSELELARHSLWGW